MWNILGQVTWDQIAGAVSRLVVFVCGYLAGKGLLNAELAEPIAAFVVAAGALAYSIWKNRRTGLVARVAALPEVEQVKVNDPVLAAKTPENVVLGKVA